MMARYYNLSNSAKHKQIMVEFDICSGDMLYILFFNNNPTFVLGRELLPCSRTSYNKSSSITTFRQKNIFRSIMIQKMIMNKNQIAWRVNAAI